VKFLARQIPVNHTDIHTELRMRQHQRNHSFDVRPSPVQHIRAQFRMASQRFSQHQGVAILVGIFRSRKKARRARRNRSYLNPWWDYLALRPLRNSESSPGHSEKFPHAALSLRPTPQAHRCDGVVLWLHLDGSRNPSGRAEARQGGGVAHARTSSGRRRRTPRRVLFAPANYREFPLSSEVSTVYSHLHNYTMVLPLGRKLYIPIARY